MEKQPRREIPKEVQDARMRGDHDALRCMARVGGNHNAALRLFDKVKDQEVVDEQSKLYTLTPEGDVLPPNPTSTSL